MRWKKKMNQGQWYRPIDILGGRDEWKICSSCSAIWEIRGGWQTSATVKYKTFRLASVGLTKANYYLYRWIHPRCNLSGRCNNDCLPHCDKWPVSCSYHCLSRIRQCLQIVKRCLIMFSIKTLQYCILQLILIVEQPSFSTCKVWSAYRLKAALHELTRRPVTSAVIATCHPSPVTDGPWSRPDGPSAAVRRLQGRWRCHWLVTGSAAGCHLRLVTCWRTAAPLYKLTIGWLTGWPEGPSGRADAMARRVSSCSAAWRHCFFLYITLVKG